MIIALLLAAQAAPPQFYTPMEKQALAVTMECQKRYFDTLEPDERRRRGAALIEESHRVCSREEAALRTVLRTRFNAKATDRVMQLVRETVREGMLGYIAR